MSIIIEGPDGSGKSTLARRLLDANKGYYLVNMSGKTYSYDVAEERGKWFQAMLGAKNIIFDRSFIISEYIYGNLYDRGSFISFDHIKLYFKKLMSEKVHLYYCRSLFKHIEDPDKDQIMEKLGTKNQLSARVLYDKMFFDLYKEGIKVVEYDYFMRIE